MNIYHLYLKDRPNRSVQEIKKTHSLKHVICRGSQDTPTSYLAKYLIYVYGVQYIHKNTYKWTTPYTVRFRTNQLTREKAIPTYIHNT